MRSLLGGLIHSFQSEGASELPLREGDRVRVHRSGGVGWVVATLLSSPGAVGEDDGEGQGAGRAQRQGLVPQGYLTRCEEGKEQAEGEDPLSVEQAPMTEGQAALDS